jgi:Pregnancy-associated plasma protein-A
MKNRSLLILLLIFSIITNSFSQATCGFDQIHDQKMKTDPVYRATMLKQEEELRQYIARNKSWLSTKTNSPQAPLYIIPVVVHVVHTGGAIGSIYNPTDVQIQNTITYLNQVYDGTYPGLEGVGEIQLQFVLAQRDPNCNPTNGINRVNGSGVAEYVTGGVELQTTNGTAELNIKNLSRWSNTAYYNIWIVNRIDGNDGTSGSFIAGYAYFPGAGALVDGTVMLATQMAPGSTTLPHEIGHAFNLYHPFQGSSGSTCPTETNCATQNDQICDIDPVTQPVGFACRTGNNPCTGTPYTINSEHNIMNYVSCPTLFTLDQKTRMLASAGIAPRFSLSTSLGGTPTNAGGTQCPPKINFQIADDTRTELTTATTGCRSYTDYTYNMTIGNNPSAAATATLNISSGTATEGVDFDVTTNGNFTTPSKIVTFPTGTNSSQSFTIRIYNDAIVDGTETFTLAYTLNNGGGNAVVGEAKPSLVLTITDNDVAPSGPSNITSSIGTNVGLLQSPFHAGNTVQKSQFLYKAAELTAAGIPAGNLIGLALNLQKNGGAAFVYQGLTIKIGATAQNSVFNGSTEFPINDAGFTTVYSSNYTTVNGWNNFNFSTPFVWNGTSNVCVVICYDNLGAIDVSDNIQAYTDGIANSNYVFQTNINCGGNFTAFSLYNGGFKPIIQFTYPDAGTIVQTTLNSSRQEYLGPNADVYFYDQTDNRLMARIKNNTNHDYGCTQVVIDRAGTSSAAFWNNSPPNYLMNKTFRVLPTTNNASGNYDITFFFAQAEVDGWQTAASQVFSNIQMVKVQSQVSDVSPGNPTGGGAVQLVTPGVGSLGTNYFLSANFTNGFSGFGFGLAGASLPVRLIDFTGRLEKNGVVLNWKTTLEQNSKGFSIERSYDGNSFTPIGFVPSAGNSNITRGYEFKDKDVAQQTNYYRLQQLDLDNHFEYSKVVTIKNSNQSAKSFLVMNNPFTSSIDLQFSQIPAGSVRIRLMDVAGRTIQSWDKNNPGLSRMRLDANSSLQAGTYILEVRANGQEYVEKLIKQ